MTAPAFQRGDALSLVLRADPRDGGTRTYPVYVMRVSRCADGTRYLLAGPNGARVYLWDAQLAKLLRRAWQAPPTPETARATEGGNGMSHERERHDALDWWDDDEDEYDDEPEDLPVEPLDVPEASVGADYRRGVQPDRPQRRECYASAFRYALDHGDQEDVRLIHGYYSLILGEPPRPILVEHAWVEIGEGVVFDGVQQRFYDKAAYYRARDAEVEISYTPREAAAIAGREKYFGPWHRDTDLMTELRRRRQSPAQRAAQDQADVMMPEMLAAAKAGDRALQDALRAQYGGKLRRIDIRSQS